MITAGGSLTIGGAGGGDTLILSSVPSGGEKSRYGFNDATVVIPKNSIVIEAKDDGIVR